jgi:exodeoxyribonuclease VII large subunit
VSTSDEVRSLSVSEAMQLAKGALESIRLTVVGEVSEFSDKPGYKAAYFTVSDGDASMPCLMWRDAYASSGVALRCGMLVEITGQFSAYVPKGRLQFSVRRLSLAGEGRLRMQVAQLAARLEAEGLMDSARKRALPRYPLRIGVVTSPRGKAVHDVLRTLRRRYPIAEIVMAGVAVEGEGAPAAIVDGLQAVARSGVDVVVLVRGGGSYEDLMPFSSEMVARAVAGCGVPVVTGIGHEPDTSIADMVADLRASTPTAAAEAVAPSVEELAGTLAREQRLLASALQRRVTAAEHRLGRVSDRRVLSDPLLVLEPVGERVDDARSRLETSLPARLDVEKRRIEAGEMRMLSAGARLLKPYDSSMRLCAARLDDLSPLAVLGRGYAAAFDEQRSRIISRTEQVAVGDRLSIRVSDGHIGCSVVSVEPEG